MIRSATDAARTGGARLREWTDLRDDARAWQRANPRTGYSFAMVPKGATCRDFGPFAISTASEYFLRGRGPAAEPQNRGYPIPKSERARPGSHYIDDIRQWGLGGTVGDRVSVLWGPASVVPSHGFTHEWARLAGVLSGLVGDDPDFSVGQTSGVVLKGRRPDTIPTVHRLAMEGAIDRRCDATFAWLVRLADGVQAQPGFVHSKWDAPLPPEFWDAAGVGRRIAEGFPRLLPKPDDPLRGCIGSTVYPAGDALVAAIDVLMEAEAAGVASTPEAGRVDVGNPGHAAATLKPATARAGASFEWVCVERPDLIEMGIHGRRKPTKRQWEHVRDYGCDAYSTSDPVPSFDTWARYVRESLRASDGVVRESRSGRTGRSIVRRDQI